jgi:predicted enzyme related to lactoylglutathione lyase
MTSDAPSRLYGPMVICRHFPETFRFYRDLLGLVATGGDGSPPWAEFEDEGSHLVLLDQGFWEKAQASAEPPKEAHGPGPVVLAIQVSSVDHAYERVRAAGGAVVNAPTDRPRMGVRAAIVRDPEGTSVEVTQKLTPPAP